MRGWESVRSELGEASLPCLVRLRATGSLGVRDGGKECINRGGELRVAAGRSVRKLLSWSKQEGMVAWAGCKTSHEC